jgi:alkylation response protein AidB-like acyl-CoA dehydrogenase
MDFEFSDSQQQLKEEARKFLADRSSMEVVRSVLDGPQSFDRGLWAELGAMGFLGTAIPEGYGGVGAGFLELCAIAEEMGRSLAPVPFASSIYLAANLLLSAGSEAQKQAYLPRLASGDLIGCIAFSEGAGKYRFDTATVVAGAHGLSGVKLPVLDGDVAHIAIVLARDEGGKGGTSLYLVDLGHPGVERETLETIDPTRSQARIAFDRVPAERLGEAGQGEAVLTEAFNKAAILVAFEQVGGAERALEMARDYALERVAFGRPIGSFQAIKHKLVDMYIATVVARSNAYFGAWALSVEASQLGLAAAAARVSASHAYQLCSTEACHIFGAMGFAWETDCHLFFRRARLLGLMLGGQSQWSDRLVDQVKRRDVTEH